MSRKELVSTIFQGVALVFGTFLLALTHNTLLLPNNLVAGGMSGLSIILQEVFGIDANMFIYVTSILLLIISFFALGKEVTYNTIVGAIIYPIMITLTQPIAKFILVRSDLSEFIVIVCLAGILFGIAHGIIYRMGYSTGGGDVIMKILSKYFHISETRANIAYNLLIIVFSGLTFGMSSFIFSVIILAISNLIIEKIIIGISNSKVFYINTEKPDEIKDLIHNEYGSGLTLIPTKESQWHKKGEVIMVVIPNREYYSFKNKIMEIDPEAFFIINNCYEVNGGTRLRNIPFME